MAYTSTVRPRLCGSKTKTGCITCKQRHVKCDEAHPSCLRCIKSGRQCQGYASPKPRRTSEALTFVNYAPTPFDPLSAQPELDRRDTRALSYFQFRTAAELAGGFSDAFWSKDMMRLARQQFAIKHALIALATVHEDTFNYESITVSDYALGQYGKAIQEVVEMRNTHTSNATEVALATCLVFSCIEGLRGHFQSCLSHIRSGTKVMQELQESAPRVESSCLPIDVLHWLFVRMDCEMVAIGDREFGEGLYLVRNVDVIIPDIYRNPDSALHDLEIIYNHVLHLLRRVELTANPIQRESDLSDSFIIQKARFVRLHHSWQLAFNRMVDSTNTTGSFSRDPSFLILNILSNSLKITLDIDMVDPECDLDRLGPIFREIVEESDQYISRTATYSNRTVPTPSPSARSTSPPNSTRAGPTGQTPLQTGDPPRASTASPRPQANIYKNLAPKPERFIKPVFTMTASCVGALYFAAAHCRDSPIRHRALALLKKCNRREGLWDSNIASTIAERIIRIEEAQDAFDSPYTPKDYLGRKEYRIPAQVPPPAAASHLPGDARVRVVDTHVGPDDAGEARYSHMPLTQEPGHGRFDHLDYHDLGGWLDAPLTGA